MNVDLAVVDVGDFTRGLFQYERFLAQVPYRPVEGCWEWTGKLQFGYGHARFRGKTEAAHRVAWRVFRGPIPEELNVLHQCDNRRCVRPDHLFLGTQLDNMRDMFAKGRQHDRSGENSGRAKLTEYAVKQIRLWYAEGEVTRAQLSAWYGVSTSTINDILNRKLWNKI